MKHSKYLKDSYIGSSILLLWVFIGCVIPNIWLALTEQLSMVQSLTNIILPSGIYLLLLSITPKIGKTSLWMIILFFFAAFQMVLLYMYGRSVIAVDMFLNVVTTNPGEVGELLGNMIFIILTIVVIYVPPIVFGIIAVTRKWRLKQGLMQCIRGVSLWMIALGIICFSFSFASSRKYRPQNDLYPVNVIYNLYLAIERTAKVANYEETSANYRFNAQTIKADSIQQTLVVIIGETSRADNWQILGYSRATTPKLMNKDGLVAFPRAISQSNTTHKSVPMLLSELDATNFGDSIYHVKSLITAFKEAGFHTYFFSNHSRNHSFIDFFGEEADDNVFIKEQMAENQTASYDTDLLIHLDNALDDSHSKKLIVLHSYGSHFNYIDRYPEDFGSFQPDRPAHATHHYRDKQMNAYDNTIEFTSNLLSDVMTRLGKDCGETSMIYVSDHGEDIFDDERRLFLHASPIPSYYQIHVPFLVWLSPNYCQNNPNAIANLKENELKYVATSQAFFHTIMQMGGVSTPKFNPTASVLDSTYTSPKPLYLNDHNEAVELKKCGIVELDIEKLKKIGIF